jgi:peptidoglycan glycosyltransferase
MGIEMTQGAWLLGLNENIDDRIERLLLNDTAHGNDITLTIDSELCKFINKQLDSNSGTVVILNYKTGEILAMVSTPAFDPIHIDPHKANGGAGEKSLINRALQAHCSPGQLFNIITASVAIEHYELGEMSFDCKGTYKIDNEIIACKKVHKEQTFEEILLNQCECSIAQLGVDMGVKNIQKACKNIGFNYQFMFSDIVLHESSINLNSLTSKYNLAKASIGRHDTMITPMHMAMIYGSIANNGKMNDIKLVKKIDGEDETSRNKSNFRKSFSYKAAYKLDKILEQNVIKGSAKSAGLLDYTVCGYSAVVQSKNEDEPQLSWFCGYLKDNEYPYAIATVIEDYDKDIDSLEKLSATILQKITNK